MSVELVHERTWSHGRFLSRRPILAASGHAHTAAEQRGEMERINSWADVV
jgi:hypothetical protein